MLFSVSKARCLCCYFWVGSETGQL